MIKSDISGFPAIYQNIELGKLIDFYAMGPVRLENVLTGLTDNELTVYPINDKWSIKEIVFHLTDSEIVGAARIKMILGEENKELPFYDQDSWVSRMAYNSLSEKQMVSSIKVFSSIRTQLTELFANLKPSDWERTGIHVEFGKVSVRDLLELYADHSERHISQILERQMILGISNEIETILPERLY